MKSRRAVLTGALLFLALAACGADEAPPAGPKTEVAQRTDAPRPDRTERFRVETVASGLEHPWSIAFLSGGRMLVTERAGRLRIVDRAGRLSPPVAGLPEVWANGQGGLLDVALSPDFATDRTIYFSYAEPRTDGNGTAVAKGVLDDGPAPTLSQAQVIFRQQPTYRSSGHFGSRLAFAPDGTLFVTLGERMSGSERAQDLATHFGKVVRIRTDGSAPPDNPFIGRAGARPEVWTWGHRNPQSAAIHPQTGELWTVEHGPRGGDEINIARKGLNFGWPEVSFGKEYTGGTVGDGSGEAEGFTPPLYYWVPSIAPSGMTFYDGEAFPAWKGNLFVGALAGQHLARLVLDGERVVAEERLLADLGARIRDVRTGPDGLIYVITDEDDGKILRLVPAR